MRRLVAILFAGLLVCGCLDRKPAVRPTESPIRFTEVADQTGLRYRFSHGGQSPLNIVELMGAGAGFIDADDDGQPDVVLASHAGVRLFRNQDGAFTDVSARAGVDKLRGRWYGLATGDYDNDGRADLFLTAHNRTVMLHNLGSFRFEDVTDRLGVGLGRWASSAAFADVNRDGFLDLYVGCYVDFGPGSKEFTTIQDVPLSLGPDGYDAQRGVLFINQGGKRFRDETAVRGLNAAFGKALGVAFADADADGDDDLAVANDQQPLDYFLNDGRGRFRNVSLENGTAYTSEGDRQGGMGLDWGDYDNDGRMDLFVANFADEPKSLYHNEGGGFYLHGGEGAGVALLTRPWVAFGTRFLDADGDGLLDLIIANGHVQDLIAKVDPANAYAQKLQMFRNAGAGKFQDVSAQAGEAFNRGIVGRALAVADYDCDGDPDVLASDLEGGPVLLRNDAQSSSRWVGVRLAGKQNRLGIGARLELETASGKQIRQIRTDASYLSASEPVARFGVGGAQRCRLRVVWPSGARQNVGEVEAGKVITVSEP